MLFCFRILLVNDTGGLITNAIHGSDLYPLCVITDRVYRYKEKVSVRFHSSFEPTDPRTFEFVCVWGRGGVMTTARLGLKLESRGHRPRSNVQRVWAW